MGYWGEFRVSLSQRILLTESTDSPPVKYPRHIGLRETRSGSVSSFPSSAVPSGESLNETTAEPLPDWSGRLERKSHYGCQLFVLTCLTWVALTGPVGPLLTGVLVL